MALGKVVFPVGKMPPGRVRVVVVVMVMVFVMKDWGKKGWWGGGLRFSGRTAAMAEKMGRRMRVRVARCMVGR